MTQNAKLYISIAQLETASLPDPNTLLARDLYDRLYSLINEAQQEAGKALNSKSDLDSLRAHNAVLIDGARGTGKSSVLVNLPTYIEYRANGRYDKEQAAPDTPRAQAAQNRNLLERVHILKPVDPTLLEEHDDLFLHVIVAAVLTDNELQNAQRDKRKESLNRDMLRALEVLAHGLESVEAQKEERGLDKLRSFIGNRQLHLKVHTFFRSVLALLDKDLLVLTIDDVDTALDRAYENLEIVRRYLNTPLVLPIISGDLDLYHEVIWREFHGKIVKPTPKYKEDQAYGRVIELATEYQRKILPVSNRLRMPDVEDYLQDFDIELRPPNKQDGPIPSLGAFHAWLEGFIAGPVNGQENSRLTLPIRSIRALTQLIRRCGQDHLLEKLPAEIRQARSAEAAKRAGQLAPGIPSEELDRFATAYANADQAQDRNYQMVYESFDAAVEAQKQKASGKSNSEISSADTLRWSKKLRQHFGNERDAGPICLVLEAMQHWYGEYPSGRSILDTALFQPLRHDEAAYANFDKQDSLASWEPGLDKQLPGYWLNDIGKRSVLLPYPLPESGRWGRLGWSRKQTVDKPEQALLLQLLTHSNYYNESSRSTKVNIGRLFELLITSLVRDVSEKDLISLLDRAPFHSTITLAPTKTQSIAADTDEDDQAEATLEPGLHNSIIKMANEIQSWRNEHQLQQVRFSPWLVYKVFNKAFNQAELFNRNQRIESGDAYHQVTFQIGLHAFYSIWSAFGSFEKGPLFGLPARISTVNLEKPSNFTQNILFRQNIRPFFPQDGNKESAVARYGQAMRAVTYYLGLHPLRRWLEQALEDQGGVDRPTRSLATQNQDSGIPGLLSERYKKLVLENIINTKETTSTTNSFIDDLAYTLLRAQLKIKGTGKKIHQKTLEESLKSIDKESAYKILNRMRDFIPDTEAFKQLETAYAQIFPDEPPQP